MKTKLDIKGLEKEISYTVQNRSTNKMGAALKALLLTSALSLGFAVSQPATAQTVNGETQSRIVQPSATASSNNSTAIRTTYSDIVERITPGVVTVRSEKKTFAQAQNSPLDDPRLREFFGDKLPQMKQQAPRVERGLGSGVIVESNGYILTNNHVVEGASKVKVDLTDKRTFDARVVGTDPASDLAVLKIEATNLPTVAIGNSDAVRVGDVVLAFGNPLGLRQTVTSGIISAKGRQTGISNGSFEDFLQTDASINQGNSGGALVNLDGQLVGINSQILSPSGGSIGLGFSIPSNMAKSVMAQLIKEGKVHRGQLGVGIQDVTSDLAANFGLKEIRGVVVNSVTPDGPAAKAGIQQGDVIISLNNVNINDGNELRNRVAQTAPNSEVNVKIVRNGAEQSVKATLGEFQAKNDVEATEEKAAPAVEPTQGKLGLSLAPLTPQLATQLKLKDAPSGLIVRDVQDGSPADDAGIQEGDILLQVNRQPVKTVEELKTAMAKAKGNSNLLLISRGGQTLFITVQV